MGRESSIKLKGFFPVYFADRIFRYFCISKFSTNLKSVRY